MNKTELTSKIEHISNMLEQGKDLIAEDPILEFQSLVNQVNKKIDEIMDQGRDLKLGIVGEVKAGKSSFLNALLFNGEDILPKAPTPMTAALTKIGYSENPMAKIVFYDKDDWGIIKTKAHKYTQTLDSMYEKEKSKYEENIKKNDKKKNSNIDLGPFPSRREFEKENADSVPAEYKACKEVIDLAKDIDVDSLLGTEKEIHDDSNDIYAYKRELNEYVGADGKYTAIVKYTEIQLNNKMLEGIEVIDTPGLNDPILSRSRTTQKFLIECDAVFLLGYCGQFLGAEDMGFVLSSLPNEGINKAVLIGSKMDSAILQYPTKNSPNFKTAYLGTKRNCEDQARENLTSCSTNAHNEKIVSCLVDSLPPKCISSLAYSAARKMERHEVLNDQEQQMLKGLTSRYSDFSADVETLYGLSNIPDVKNEVFASTKAQKEKIIAERIDTIVKSQVVRFQSELENIAIQARANLSDLKKYDCDQLEERLDNMKETLDSVRIIVKNLFEKNAIDMKCSINDIALEVERAIASNMDIEVVHSSKTKHHSNTSGILIWKKTEHWDEVIHNSSVDVSDVDDNIRNYIITCSQIINSNYKRLFDIEKFKSQVKETVIKAFDTSDKEFDENKILIPLENALSRIMLPSINIDREKYEKQLDSLIGGYVSKGTVLNEDIPQLKRAQDKVLSAISDDIVSMIKSQGDEMDKLLVSQGALFVDSIVNQLEDNQKKLEVMIHDKQQSMKRFDDFIATISESKKILFELGA